MSKINYYAFAEENFFSKVNSYEELLEYLNGLDLTSEQKDKVKNFGRAYFLVPDAYRYSKYKHDERSYKIKYDGSINNLIAKIAGVTSDYDRILVYADSYLDIDVSSLNSVS